MGIRQLTCLSCCFDTTPLSPERREETLKVGPEAIVQLASKIPGTSHPLTDSSKFVVDTWQHPGSSAEFPDTLFVSVHGEYNERQCQVLPPF